jgi:hypothetical protein
LSGGSENSLRGLGKELGPDLEQVAQQLMDPEVALQVASQRIEVEHLLEPPKQQLLPFRDLRNVAD